MRACQLQQCRAEIAQPGGYAVQLLLTVQAQVYQYLVIARAGHVNLLSRRARCRCQVILDTGVHVLVCTVTMNSCDASSCKMLHRVSFNTLCSCSVSTPIFASIAA